MRRLASPLVEIAAVRAVLKDHPRADQAIEHPPLPASTYIEEFARLEALGALVRQPAPSLAACDRDRTGISVVAAFGRSSELPQRSTVHPLRHAAMP